MSTPSPVSNTAPPSSSSTSSSSSSTSQSNTSSFDIDKQAFETSEYDSQYGLSLIKASSAYARGATGEGALIGIMDSGVDTSHEELNGTGKFTDDSYLSYASRFPSTEEKRHGTHVSAIAVGEKDGLGMHGVAFDAQLFFISIELSEPPDDYEPVTIDPTVDYTAVDNAWSQLEEYFTSRGVTVVNGSFGYQGNINEYTEENLRYAFPKTINVLAQAGTSPENRTIFVWSAGNGGGYADEGVDYSSPEVFGGMAYLLTELQGHSVAVVSVDSNGEISSFSNRCGVSKDYCIAAPGRSIYSAYAQDFPINNDYRSFSGTSMAAPHVSGGIALLASYFRGQVGNTEILERLFTTANKSGIYSDESIYGQGLMDLETATRPIGQTMVAVSQDMDKLYYSEASTSLNSLGPAFGDGWLSALHGKEFVVFDQLGAPFFKPLSSTYLGEGISINRISSYLSNSSKRIIERSSDISTETQLTLGIAIDNFGEHNYSQSLWPKNTRQLKHFSLKQSLSSKSFYFLGSGTSPAKFFSENKFNTDSRKEFGFYGDYEIPYLSFVKNGNFFGGGVKLSDSTKLTGSFFKGLYEGKEKSFFDLNQKKSSGFMFEYNFHSYDSDISLQTGLLEEQSALLGSLLNGGYGSLRQSKTIFSGFSSSLNLYNFNFLSSFFLGETKSDLTNLGLIKDLSKFTSSSFKVGIKKNNFFLKDDSLSIHITQPLRIEKGVASFSIPIGRTKLKKIILDEFDANVSPSGRELNFELVHKAPLIYGYLYTRFGLVKDEGHINRNKLEPFFETYWEVKIF